MANAVSETPEAAPKPRESFEPSALFRRVLVPINFSELARRALLTGIDFQERYGSDIFLHTAVRSGDAEGFLAGIGGAQWSRDDMLEETRDHLRAYLRMHASHASPPKTFFDAVIQDELTVSIRDAVERLGITLVLIATHAPDRRRIFRSRAERVVKMLSCPVFVIQTDIPPTRVRFD